MLSFTQLSFTKNVLADSSTKEKNCQDFFSKPLINFR